MSVTFHHEFLLPDPDATAALGTLIGPLLRAGDALLLSGDIGAGKTHFARASILSRLPIPEPVPSPTFTLVQVYETGTTEIWHADLYRLTGPDGCVELGLDQAFDDAICLIEWPDRLGDLTPENALHLDFAATEQDQRRVTLHATSGTWAQRLAKLFS